MNMATYWGNEFTTESPEGCSGRLTNRQYVRLGRAISSPDMESIALGYLNIDEEIIKSLRYEHRGNSEAFNRDILKRWAYRNPGSNQVENLAHLLYAAASECSYVNPHKVEKILLVPLTENDQSEPSKEHTISEEELLSIADRLRPYTEEAMKIEMAPWIREYEVDMDELYTELTLEKVKNKLTGILAKTIKDYRDLFDDRTYRMTDQMFFELSDIHQNILSYFELKVKGNKLASSLRAYCLRKLKKLKFQSAVSSTSSDKDDKVLYEFLNCFKWTKRVKQKILIKGEPGMGKTTFCKKVAWDWAKKIFTTFDIVLLVFLKLVKPGDVIENVIIQQNPFIRGLNITDKRLKSILHTFGNRCLIILDGLDEHALGTNKDVLKIIKGEKCLDCNIILTSRPHSTNEIQRYFPMMVRVDGFTTEKAAQFVSKILRNNQKREAVLNFKPADFEDDVPIQKCPILLSFICLLVREDEIDLSDKTIHIGEIYTRMVRCLYKKFAIRKGISFIRSNFINAIVAIGKLALEFLLSGNALLQKSYVVKEVGPDAFDYGLLIGHEDGFYLLRDETADIFVTFPHRSLQEFLGAFYFVWMLDKQQKLESLLGSEERPIFMTNPLFLKFCLWFCSDQIFVPFEKKEEVRQCLRNRCLKSMRSPVLDAKDTSRNYPALDFKAAHRNKDVHWMEFLASILLNCNTTNILVTGDEDPFSWILRSMERVTCIKHGQLFSYYWGNRILLNLENASWGDVSKLGKYFTKFVEDPLVYLYLQSPRDSHEIYRVENLKSLFLEFGNEIYLDVLPLGCRLTHVCIKAVYKTEIMQKWIMQLSQENRTGSIPCVSNLSLIECYGVNGNLRKLFTSTWAELSCLNLDGTRVIGTDLEFLCSACNEEENILPKLTSLFLYLPDDLEKDTVSTKLFALPWMNLKQLFVQYPANISDRSIQTDLYNALNSNNLPNLTSLGLRRKLVNNLESPERVCTDNSPESPEPVCTDNSLESPERLSIDRFPHIDCLILSGFPISSTSSLRGQLSYSELVITSCGEVSEVIANSSFPLLKKLVIRQCDSVKEDIRSLVEANQEGRLPQLKHLDISNNVLSATELKCLFGGGCTWNHLLSLNLLCNQYENNRGIIDCLNEVVSRGCLLSLQELAIDYFEVRETCWSQLRKLYLLHCSFDDLGHILDSADKDFLPVLYSVCAQLFFSTENAAKLFRRLSEKGISIHQRIIPVDDPFSTFSCVCQTGLIDNMSMSIDTDRLRSVETE